jgi:hypothetical protein
VGSVYCQETAYRRSWVLTNCSLCSRWKIRAPYGTISRIVVKAAVAVSTALACTVGLGAA